MSLTDMNSFEIISELLDTDNEVIYEVLEKANPSRKYTLKIFKNLTGLEFASILYILYRSHSNKPDSLKIQAFPKIYSDFNCLEKNSQKINHAILFEYVPSTMRSYILENREKGEIFSFLQIYRIYQSFINALGYLEINGMYHGQLTPDTVGISKENVIKLMDFEKFKKGIGILSKNEDFPIIEVNRYLAPELKTLYYEQKTYKDEYFKYNGNRTDVYSLGVILLELGGELISDIIEPEDLEKEIKGKIEHFRKKYKNEIEYKFIEIFEKFIKILQRILCIEPNERPTPYILLKKSLKFINKGYVEKFIKIMEEDNIEDIFESLKSSERYEIIGNSEKFDWMFSGYGDQALSLASSELILNETFDSLKVISSLNLDIKLNDSKKTDLKEFLKKTQILIQKLYSEKKLTQIDTFHLQANPSKKLCMTSPEMLYFWNSLFSKGEMELSTGIKYSIMHDINCWNGVSNDQIILLLNHAAELCKDLVDFRLVFASWLDLTMLGVKEIVDFISTLSFKKLKSLEIGIYSHSADSLYINALGQYLLKGLKESASPKLESFTFFAFTSSPQDQCLSSISDILKYETNLKDLNIHLRQITKSANFTKFIDSLSLNQISTLNTLKLGFASTIEPYINDESILKIYQKLIKGISLNQGISSLGLYLLSWGDIEKSFYTMQDIFRDKCLVIDVYFYGKGPEKQELEVQAKFKESLKKSKINSFFLEFSNKIKQSPTFPNV